MTIADPTSGAMRRREDPPLLTGAARYTDDLAAPGALQAAFVRAPLAHGRVLAVETAAAAAMPAVVGVFTAADLALPPMPAGSAPAAFARPVLAEATVRFLGEPVAVVVAETRAQALDAVEAVAVDYEPLPVVVDPLAAADDQAPLLFPEAGSNLAKQRAWPQPSTALEGAEVVVTARFVNQRLAAVPLEPNAALAVPDPERDAVTLYVPCQAPFWVRDTVAETLGLPAERVRVVAPAVGGGFGARIATYPEQVVVAALARRLGRPVRYVESRSESMVAMTHGRAQVQEVELGATRDGTLTGLRARVVGDGGAYPGEAAYLPASTRLMASGVYRIPRIEVATACVVTNTTPVAAYRGAGRPEATAMLERAVDLLAGELGMDPAELRRRNLLHADELPYVTPTQARYDSGDFPAALERVLEAAGYPALRAEQAERRRRGDRRQLGVGLSVYVEVTGFGSEHGAVAVEPDGRVTVRTGTAPHGQGHETAFTQLVATTLGVDPDEVTVVHSDTALVPRGDGTMGSRSLQVGGSAILQAAEQVLDKARTLTAHLLEARIEDVAVFPGEGLGVAGAPSTALPWRELATAAADPARRPAGAAAGLDAAADLPGFETMRTQTPTPRNPLGAKGIGESGAVGATPAVQNAVVDALGHLGVTHVDLPLTPERVWRAIRAAAPPGM